MPFSQLDTLFTSGEFCNKKCQSLLVQAKLHVDSPTSLQRNFLMCTHLNLTASNIQNCESLLLVLERLRVLDLSHNVIEKLPDVCKSMRMLDYVDVSHNRLSKFPEWILQLKNASTIKLGNNPLNRSFLPHFMKAEWERVEDCSLENLNLIAVPNCILNSKFLCTFTFGSLLSDRQCEKNCLWSFPDHFPVSITAINFAQISLTSLDYKWQVCSKLRTFSAQGNDLLWIPDSFVTLHALEECNLSSCGLFLLPNAFGNLVNLRVLNLSFNKLTTIPKSCELLVHLEQLDLYDNGIETVLCDLQLLKCLRGCDLWFNYIDPSQFLLHHAEMCREIRDKFSYGSRQCIVKTSLNQEDLDTCSIREQETASSVGYEDENDLCEEPKSDPIHLDPRTDEVIQNWLSDFSCEESWDDAADVCSDARVSKDLIPVKSAECEEVFHPAECHATTQVSSHSMFPIVPGQFDDY